MHMETFYDLFRAVGFQVNADKSDLILEIDEYKFRVTIDAEWRSWIANFYKAKQYTFNEERRILSGYKSLEVQLLRIDPSFTTRTEHEFSDGKGVTVRVSQASPEFSIALLSSRGSQAIDMIKRRLLRRGKMRKPDKDGYVRILKFDDLVYIPTTAKYLIPRKINPDQLFDKAIKSIKASLFKISYSSGECWDLRESILSIGVKAPRMMEDTDFAIPKAVYNDDLVKFYKVAKSSIFPNQEFLSYYHILEYHFLRISDEILHTSIKSLINSPSFSPSYQNINKLISVLKKNDNSSDETEMLKSVLRKYIEEEDLIEYITALEKNSGKQIYTDPKKKFFGESATIQLTKGHAVNNTAKVIKLIRNALVHSSDRYNREDCFMPFSESEAVVISYIPIIKFLAEKVIFATAECA